MFDEHQNFAISTIATAPYPATTGTSLVVQAGDGTKFPAPDFNATVWPPGVAPTDANAEIVRITNISTDTFTIVRTQEGTSVQAIGAGWQIGNTITAKVIADIEGAFNTLNGDVSTLNGEITVLQDTSTTKAFAIAMAASLGS